MTKDLERLNTIINNEIETYCLIIQGYMKAFSNYTDISTAVKRIEYYYTCIQCLIDIAHKMELIDSTVYFEEAISEFINRKRSTCPTTDDFRLDETEMM